LSSGKTSRIYMDMHPPLSRSLYSKLHAGDVARAELYAIICFTAATHRVDAPARL
jgi:hypothetical protein